jgi:VIT1/CCC1 family predicted Fe2+/Mn2+ transporter
MRVLTRRYVRDLVYAANDGLITTFAVVAGARGANMGPTSVLILGFANLAADGLSMGAGNYLGITSERAARAGAGYNARPEALRAARHGAVTWLSFVVIGLIPLAPFLGGAAGESAFRASVALTGAALFSVGALRTFATRRSRWRGGLEMLAVGSLAGGAAYAAGLIAERLAGGITAGAIR